MYSKSNYIHQNCPFKSDEIKIISKKEKKSHGPQHPLKKKRMFMLYLNLCILLNLNITIDVFNFKIINWYLIYGILTCN